MKVIFLKGLPGSGKSTWAKQWVEENSISRVRINKDDLRLLLHQGRFSKGNEKQILRLEEAILLDSLNQGKNVVLDNTHLSINNIGANIHHQRILNLLFKNGYTTDSSLSFSKMYVEVILKDFTNVPPEKCIENDLKRINSVGQNVIWEMYWNNVAKIKEPLLSPTKKDAIIVDIDGTLACMHNRGPYEWSKIDNDNVRIHIRNLVNIYARSGYKVIILTGRDGCCLETTKDWLLKKNVIFDEVFSRTTKDNRPDYIIKEELYLNNIEPYYNIHLVVDDRPQVIRLWRRLGLPVINANPCDKDF